MEQVIGPLLSAIIAAAPGLLALITGKQTDEEAKAHALAQLASLRLIDVDGIIAAHRKAPPRVVDDGEIDRLVEARVAGMTTRKLAAPLVHASDVTVIRALSVSTSLSHEERGALSRVLPALRSEP